MELLCGLDHKALESCVVPSRVRGINKILTFLGYNEIIIVLKMDNNNTQQSLLQKLEMLWFWLGVSIRDFTTLGETLFILIYF